MFWPSPDQEWLLRASLLRGEQARAAFVAWEAGRELGTLDGGSTRLLPLLYQNLLEQQPVDRPELLSRLRGVYRHNWHRNHLQLAAVSRLLTQFTAAGIPTLLLKGVPLGLLYYPKLGMRPMDDADILIPTDRASQALEVVAAAGLRSRFAEEEWPPHLIASKTFADRDGWEFDLHTNVMHDCRGPGADADFWQAAIPLTVGHAHTLTLSAEDHVLHILVHAMRPHAGSPIRWAADATMVIRRQGLQFDWHRLWQRARARRMSLAVGSALRYLKARLAVDVPVEALAVFDRSRAGLTERFEFNARTRPGVGWLAACRLADYLRARDVDRDWRGPLGFVRFMRDTWALDSAWRVPAAAGVRTAGHLKRALGLRQARQQP